jgi:hypothetical protein
MTCVRSQNAGLDWIAALQVEVTALSDSLAEVQLSLSGVASFTETVRLLPHART